MNDLFNLHQLAAQGIGRHVQTPHGSVQPGHALDVLSTAAHLRETQTGHPASGDRKSNLAGAVIRRTASDWGVI